MGLVEGGWDVCLTFEISMRKDTIGIPLNNKEIRSFETYRLQ